MVMAATGGRLLCGSRRLVFSGISIDSRTVSPDQLFVALPGQRHDGHQFIADVVDRGIRGLVVSEAKINTLPLDRIIGRQIACICVQDTLQALGAMARFNRRRAALSVLAITGSNGKTSTRMLTEKVLDQAFVTLATQGNFNTDIGLPLTLFRLGSVHQAAVLELGMRASGEIAYLGRICEPDVGVITNVKPCHLERMGSMEAIARAKGELLEVLSPKGVAVLNADDPSVRAMGEKFGGTVIWFGTDENAQIRATAIRSTESGVSFTLKTPSGSLPVTLATPARVMVENALAAAAAGVALGLSPGQIQRGLELFEPQPGRMGIYFLPQEVRLLDDTYNANPASMAAAIDTLAGFRLRHGHPTVAVLGDMLELGDAAPDFHRQLGAQVADLGIDRLFVTGAFADAVIEGAVSRNMPLSHIFKGDKSAIGAELYQQMEKRSVILVKGSRTMAMEDVVEDIRRRADAS